MLSEFLSRNREGTRNVTMEREGKNAIGKSFWAKKLDIAREK